VQGTASVPYIAAGRLIDLSNRAVDNQIYVAMCSPARDMSAEYHAVRCLSLSHTGLGLNLTSYPTQWGHSMIVDPM
jgi:omega-amidase